ncbi:transcriptional regulator, partial [Streptomyces cellulosae]
GLAAGGVLPAPPGAPARALSRLLGHGVADKHPHARRSLPARMHPLVVQALLTTFQRSLKEELREWLDEDG